MNTTKKIFATFAAAAAMAAAAPAQTNDILKNFQNPPKDAMPQVWWHWMNSNITRDGIRKDIMWMHRSGITGFHLFDAGLGTPQIVDHPVGYLTPEWKACVKLAVSLADSLGMDVTIPASPGWSCTGGPWVKPQEAMKKLTWRTMRLKGGKRVKTPLPEPFKNTGWFLDLDNGEDSRDQYYQDIAVVAVKLPATDIDLVALKPVLTTSGGEDFSVEQLNNQRVKDGKKLTPDANGKLWIDYAFSKPQTVRSLTYCDGRQRGNWVNDAAVALYHLESSDNGKDYRKVCDILQGGAYRQTVSIPPTTAKHFRLVCDRPNGAGKDAYIHLSELELHAASSVNFAEEHAGFTAYSRLDFYPTPADAPDAVDPADIVDITDKTDANGNIDWDAPSGNWMVYRFGYSLIGKLNHPASPQGTGLEVDKLSDTAMRNYLSEYFNIYSDATGGRLGKHGINGLLVDSYEAGNATWTPRMAQEFQARRGYSLTKWLPAIAGRIIGSPQETERFLFDFRTTIGDLICDNFYGVAADEAHKRGMTTFFEAHETARQYAADGIGVKKNADIPMGAMWTGMHLHYSYDIRESASTAHIYGKKMAAGESMTAAGVEGMAYSYYPENLKPVADYEMASGLNKFVVHESAHQPVDDKRPGLSLGQYGQYFNRHETWAERARPWMDYLGRSCYMMQEGKNIADIAYYYGVDNCPTGIAYVSNVELPAGYNYDFMSPEALLKETTAGGGELKTTGGVSYKALWLSPLVVKMTVAELRKIKEIVSAGVYLCGAKPTVCPALKDDPAEWQRLVSDIWESGRKNVIPASAGAMQTAGVAKDVDYRGGEEVRFVHHSIPGGEFYWISNATDRPLSGSVSLRIAGKTPEIWRAEDGSAQPASYTISGGRTAVDLNGLEPHGAVFIVLQKPAEGNAYLQPRPASEQVANLSEGWTVGLDAAMGVPAELQLPKLASLTESANANIKYYSGKAIYTKTFKLAKKPRKGEAYKLNLGEVANMATVVLNGDTLPTVWHSPFTIDITHALRKGNNSLAVEVINPWRNRIIGDRQPGIAKRYTFLGYDGFFDAKSKLFPTGLIGPVTITKETAPKQ